MPTFEELARAAYQRAVEAGAAPPLPDKEPEPEPTAHDIMARAIERRALTALTELQAEADAPPPGPVPPQGRPAFEEFVCQECRTVDDFADHDDDHYIWRTCGVCKPAGRGRKIGRNTGITTWARIRIEPEYRHGEPAGTWRPVPRGMQGLWEKSPDQAAIDAEKARRIATI